MPRIALPVVLSLAALAIIGFQSKPSAWAEEPAPLRDLRCRTFNQRLDDSSALDTNDRTREIGQWVATEREKGWRVHDVDFEIAQKQSGFPQGFVQVCLRR